MLTINKLSKVLTLLIAAGLATACGQQGSSRAEVKSTTPASITHVLPAAPLLGTATFLPASYVGVTIWITYQGVDYAISPNSDTSALQNLAVLQASLGAAGGTLSVAFTGEFTVEQSPIGPYLDDFVRLTSVSRN